MKERDRQRFRALIAAARADGATLTAAIERAYAWLLKSAKDVWL